MPKGGPTYHNTIGVSRAIYRARITEHITDQVTRPYIEIAFRVPGIIATAGGEFDAIISIEKLDVGLAAHNTAGGKTFWVNIRQHEFYLYISTQSPVNFRGIDSIFIQSPEIAVECVNL